jgi:hypothetical protein
MVNIPSIFYGSSIKKGTLSLKTYVSGTLAAELTDQNRRGELVQSGSNSVVGTVLYDEGIILLTGSTTIGSIGSGGSATNISWLNFGYGLESEPIDPTALSASFSLDFQGVSQTSKSSRGYVESL